MQLHPSLFCVGINISINTRLWSGASLPSYHKWLLFDRGPHWPGLSVMRKIPPDFTKFWSPCWNALIWMIQSQGKAKHHWKRKAFVLLHLKLAKPKPENTAQLADFIQSDMWEVITNGTTVSSLTAPWASWWWFCGKKMITKIGRFNNRNPYHIYLYIHIYITLYSSEITKEMLIVFDLILVSIMQGDVF